MTKIMDIDCAQRNVERLNEMRRDAYNKIEAILRAVAGEVEEINAQHYNCRAFSESELRNILYDAEILVERLTDPTARFIRDDATPPEPFDGDYPDWLRGDR
jgi:hypothetical protein